YFATSIADFWSRWHISLSTWFRDYVYIPLGGNRVGRLRHHRNILITFVISGLWHGAAWNFIIWGLIHGVFSCIGRKRQTSGRDAGSWRTRYGLPDWGTLWSMIFTFHVVCIGWVFFRASSVERAFSACKAMLWTMWLQDDLIQGLRST